MPDNDEFGGEPMFYTDYEENSQAQPESGEFPEQQGDAGNMFYTDYDQEYIPPPPDRENEFKADDFPKATPAEKLFFCISVILSGVFVFVSTLFVYMRKQMMFQPMIALAFFSLIPIAVYVLLFFLSIYYYNKSLKRRDKILIGVIRKRTPAMRYSIAVSVLISLCLGAEAYVFSNPDKFVFWVMAALVAAAAVLIIVGFPLLIREKALVVFLAGAVLYMGFMIRMVPIENFKVTYMYVSPDGYESVSGQPDELFYGETMSEGDFLASMAYVNEKAYLETNVNNEKFSFSSKNAEKSFLDFFQNPGYAVKKLPDNLKGSENRYMTLVFPLRDKNDRVYVDQLAYSTAWSYSSYKVKTDSHKYQYPISLYRDHHIFPMDEYYSIVHDNDIKAYCIIAVESYWDIPQWENIKKLLVLDDDNEGKDYQYAKATGDTITAAHYETADAADTGTILVAYQDCYCEYHISYI